MVVNKSASTDFFPGSGLYTLFYKHHLYKHHKDQIWQENEHYLSTTPTISDIINGMFCIVYEESENHK